MKVDVLIPTYRRPAGLAVTLTSLTSQDFRDFRIVLSDQTEDEDLAGVLEVQAALRVLRLHGHTIDFHKHLPRRGMAEQRQFLLDQVEAPYALFLDDDVILERDVIRRMIETIERERCGFVPEPAAVRLGSRWWARHCLGGGRVEGRWRGACPGTARGARRLRRPGHGLVARACAGRRSSRSGTAMIEGALAAGSR